MEEQYFDGFSKLSREEKLNVLSKLVDDPGSFIEDMKSYRLSDEQLQKRFEQFSENTVSNFHLPFGIAPNFLIDDTLYHVPMVTEESSVIAAASKAAKFWFARGGFQTEKISTLKRGHVHFMWYGETAELDEIYQTFERDLKQNLSDITASMEKRGGGIREVWLSERTDELENYFQVGFSFETVDSMGANFINSALEKAARVLKEISEQKYPGKLEVIMAILSNYSPGSYVQMKVECPVSELKGNDEQMSGEKIASRFKKAVDIANHSVSRAVTNNKGIMNGVDAVVMATGNDFRAVEAGAHAFSVTHGRTSSLSNCEIENNQFVFRLTIPLALGTVGGLTSLHPLASKALQLLGNPSARELMKIVAAVGLASNFSAIRSLVTTGIQKGHMKLHLENILMSLNVDEKMKEKIKAHFKGREVSYSMVKAFVEGEL